jgi:inhibitor of cysteine peptidase
MVQQEVKKKTRVYGTVAILAAMVLVSLIYVFGGAPGLTPNSPTTNPGGNPNTNPGTNPNTNPTVIPEASPMKTFASLEELRNYLNANSAGSSVYGGGPLDSKYFASDNSREAAPVPQPQAPSAAAPTTSSPNLGVTGTAGTDYSTTNIQVAGVDEADTTKNDGSYIYTASNDYSTGQNYVYIVKADPTNPGVIAKIPLDNNTYLAGMFLSQDSSKLIIIGSQYRIYALGVADAGGAEPALGIAISPNYYSDVNTFVNVYDISNKAHPTLARNFTLSGSYFNSRMIGDYIYTVVSQSAYVYNNAVPLPKVYTTTGTAEVPATRVYYSDTANFTDAPYTYFTFTSFYGLNLKDTSQLTNMTVLMGGASTMYVSPGNMYVTYPTWTNGQYTTIYRVSIDNGKLTFQAKGNVPGSVLNQYSMDEYNGYFRLTTTNWKDTTQNAVYVLNMNLTTVGALELKNTEVRETIQSTRFLGDKAYVVTFQQKDPFFVLDMSNPTAPKVAGKLEIPGYSSYLHPYDENHIIGLGMENNSVKLSLFDVTNVNAPKEIAKYTVQADYSYSEASYDPKAFLFNKDKQLLVIPVSITRYGTISPALPDAGGKVIATPIQGGYWQGAYVFKLTAAGGFELKGAVAHQDYTSTQQYYGYDYTLTVNRALYINNTLYTVSNAKVKLNSLTDLAPIAEVKLS